MSEYFITKSEKAQEIQRLALNNPTVYGYLQHGEVLRMGWTDTLERLVIALVSENEFFKSRLLKEVHNRPDSLIDEIRRTMPQKTVVESDEIV